MAWIKVLNLYQNTGPEIREGGRGWDLRWERPRVWTEAEIHDLSPEELDLIRERGAAGLNVDLVRGRRDVVSESTLLPPAFGTGAERAERLLDREPIQSAVALALALYAQIWRRAPAKAEELAAEIAAAATILARPRPGSGAAAATSPAPSTMASRAAAIEIDLNDDKT